MACSPSSHRDEDSLGLMKLIYEPKGILPYLDIVLVHGLGWTSTDTWTKEGPQPSFWPDWLRDKGPLRMARVWLMGYRAADFNHNLLQQPHVAIDRFVRRLWDRLAKNSTQKTSPEMQIPVVFVAHSTGGIMVKQAYLFDTRSDPRSTCAVLFLATPHKAAAVRLSLAWSQEQGRWQAEPTFEQMSWALDNINGRFVRTEGDGLHIASFSEGLPTKNGFIVDKTSSHLGFPREIVESIDADHDNIARYSDPNDPGFTKVSRQLQLFLHWLGPFKRRVWSLDSKEKTNLLHRFLGVNDAPYDDLAFFYNQCSPGTTEWIESDPQYLDWVEDLSPHPRILFLSGLPGSGKSVLASYIVRRLKDEDMACHFFFFRHDVQSKQSIVSLLGSLAFQMAEEIELFRSYMVAHATGGYSLSYDTEDLIWNKLFANELSNLLPDREFPIYWIIDGLDMCDSGEIFLSGLTHPSLSSIPLRVLITSRTTSTLPRTCDQLGAPIRLNMEQKDAKREATRSLIRAKLKEIPTHLIDQAVYNAQGNYLEADRVIREVLRHGNRPPTVGDVKMSQLDPKRYWVEIVSDMRAAWGIGEENRAKGILTLVAYARSPLTVEQLHEATSSYGSSDLDQRDLLEHYGALLHVDGQSRVTIRHRTAWEFLTDTDDHSLCHEPLEGHGILLAVTLKAMTRIGTGIPDGLSQTDPWTEYAITSWEYHLSRSAAHRDGKLLSLLGHFLDGPGVIWWMYMLARSNQLNLLMDASATLTAVHRRRYMVSPKHHVDSILRPWATELVRILGRFGSHLLRQPRALYEVVPQFCPAVSLVRKQLAGPSTSSRITVKGVPNEVWDDTLARIPVDNPSRVICTNQYVAVSSSGKSRVQLVSTANPCEMRIIDHEGRVNRMRFSNSGHMLALASIRTISVWQIDIWLRRWNFTAPAAAPMLDMAFDGGDDAVLACFRDGSVWRYPLDDFAASSRCLGSVLAVGHDGNSSAPSFAAFNQSATMLAVAYHNCPMSVWDVSSGGLHGPRSRSGKPGQERAQDPVQQIDWTPTPYHVLSISGGSARMWDPDRQVERHICNERPREIRCSPTRRFFVTSHDDGVLAVWKITDLARVYVLKYYNSLNGLALCPYGRNIYALRGNSCDVLNLSFPLDSPLHDDQRHAAETHLDTSQEVMSSRTCSFAEPRAPVEVLAVANPSAMFCTAHSRGGLKIFEANGNELLTHYPPYSVTIQHAVWSRSGEYLGFTDDMDQLHVHKIARHDLHWSASFQTQLVESACQILFHETKDSILIASSHSLRSWSFKQPSPPSSSVSFAESYWWLNHPHQPDLLLGLHSKGIHLLKWDTLEPVTHLTFCFPENSQALRTNKTSFVEPPTQETAPCRPARTFTSSDGSRILMQTSLTDGRDLDLFFVDVGAVDAACRARQEQVVVTRYPRMILDRISRPLGFIKGSGKGDTEAPRSKDVLAFLDKAGWFCTFDPEGGLSEYSTFLPHDWMEQDCLSLACLTYDGTLYVPKDGLVGIIAHGFEKVLGIQSAE
ncbi:uncharacterized protein Z518_00896 [Rhinocladiella mackenziei CBS 650.93]|uniref:Rhinocladiella mackenziei CBS 650.93 unplaced genomic scaffold supercont1.1, whole genome shotgun sequence n=1 Tax=Rhinocladiella mackenziei CBS 650.93 TaxID=1442369 RepID=A0A0D2JK09_9EURO|nr:uncharacterized protein Z518_00896 [Rhinocladiella mackenziei CBS 650.93]KIX09815.1 hypothetical protein Z518_00896 [Rhinocladiella mackenziei CBS 650.93]